MTSVIEIISSVTTTTATLSAAAAAVAATQAKSNLHPTTMMRSAASV